QMKLALLKVLPEIVRESVRPIEAIDSIKIVQVDGLTQRGAAGENGGNGHAAGGSGNLANDAGAAAVAYRAQAPVIDGLMKELGLDGSLGAVLRGALPAEKVTLDGSSVAPRAGGPAPTLAARAVEPDLEG